MSLVGQTVWVVGGVGVVGRGIARGLLKAGATVIVNSRSSHRLEQIRNDLPTADEDRLVCGKGSFLQQPSELVHTVLKNRTLNHVVAHGAVRYWTTKRATCDETFSLDASPLGSYSPTKFATASSQLATLHFSAAQELLPHILKQQQHAASYNFVTGDGSGHPGYQRTAMGILNSHHVWGLAAALAQEYANDDIGMRELRVGLAVNRPPAQRVETPRDRPLSEDIGDICAGFCATPGTSSQIIKIENAHDLAQAREMFSTAHDPTQQELPSYAEFAGSL